MTMIKDAADALKAAGIGQIVAPDYVQTIGADARDVIITENPDVPDEYFVAMYLGGFELLEWDVSATVTLDKLVEVVKLFLGTEYAR